MLQSVGSVCPGCIPRREPDHLLAGAKGVDHTGDGLGGKGAAGLKLGKGDGGRGVGDDSGGVPEVLGGHGLVDLEACRREEGVADELDGVVVAGASDGRVGEIAPKVGLRPSFDADKTGAKVILVGVNLVPLGRGDGASPVAAAEVVREFGDGDEAAIFARSGRCLQGGKSGAAGGNKDVLEGDAIGLETRGGLFGLILGSGEDEDGRFDVAVEVGSNSGTKLQA